MFRMKKLVEDNKPNITSLCGAVKTMGTKDESIADWLDFSGNVLKQSQSGTFVKREYRKILSEKQLCLEIYCQSQRNKHAMLPNIRI